MLLPIRLTSLEVQRIAMEEFWVTWMYQGVTWKFDLVVTKEKANWYVLHMGMLVPHTIISFG